MLGQRIYIKTMKGFQLLRRNFLKIAALAIIFYAFYWVVNDLFIERSLIPDANNLMQQKNYKSAIKRYKIAAKYYEINHYTLRARKKYCSVTYKITLCLLEQQDSKKAYENIFNTEKHIKWQYGYYSKENAYFIKNYLIDFYLKNENLNLARAAFKNLIIIDKKIGYSNSEMADLMRIAGDIYFKEKNVNAALESYSKAYETILREKNIDYEIFANVTNKICENQIQINMVDDAIKIYQQSIQTVRAAEKKQDFVLVNFLIKLGNIYATNDSTMNSAVLCYEEAISISKKLPQKTLPRQNLENYTAKYKKLSAKNSFIKNMEHVNAPSANKI